MAKRPFTDDEVRRIAAFVSGNEFIYNPRHSDHLNKNKILRSLDDLGQTFEPKRSGEDILKKWKYLKDQFRSKQRKEKERQTSSAQQKAGRYQWKFYNDLRFCSSIFEPSSDSLSVEEYVPLGKSLSDENNNNESLNDNNASLASNNVSQSYDIGNASKSSELNEEIEMPDLGS